MPRVVLITMPFAGFRQPSLALGILKSTLAPLDVEVTVLDATLECAALIGADTYDAISTWRAVDLLGDWVFSAALARHPQQPAEDYVRQILAGGAAEHDVPYFGKVPVGARLLSALHEARRSVGELLDRCLDEVAAARPLVVGFSSSFHQHAASLALAERLKGALPDTCVVFGGANCRGVMGAELLRSFSCVDAVASGEGERVLPELVRRRLAGTSLDGIPGLLTAAGARRLAVATATQDDRRAAPVDLDRLPLADYGDYFARLEGGPLKGTFVPRVPIETSRGCWWGARSRCAFCGQASDTLAFRHKSVSTALSEIEALAARHPSCAFFVTDEILATSYLRHFVPALRTRVPGVRLIYVQLRPTLGKEQLRLLAESGVERLEVGIESLSTPVLKAMRKGTTALQGVQLLRWARELKIEVVWNVIWGLPGEDPEEYQRMAELVPQLSHLQPPNAVGVFRLERFSPIFEDPHGSGVRDVRPYPAYEYVYDLPPESLAQLAYYFAFAYETAQAVDAYTAPLAHVIATWKEHASHSRLTFSEDGRKLTVRDRRPGSDPDELTVLDGEHRLLYLACDRARTGAQLAAALAKSMEREVDIAEIEALLEPLVAQGLMMKADGSYLALGVPYAV